MSLFFLSFRNETRMFPFYHFRIILIYGFCVVNIHTSVRLMLWGMHLIPPIDDTYSFNLPELLFMGFAFPCLLSSEL